MPRQTYDRTEPPVALRDFEDLKIGERFPIPARTLGFAHFTAYQTVSMDNHPIHYDQPYCEALGHRDLLAHGLQVLSHTAAGAGLFPHVIGEALIGFVEVQAKFLLPVYRGDTLYPCLEITELVPQRTTGLVTMRASVENQDGALVLEGMHKYLLRLRAPAGAED